jgi:hypothetical protein
MCRMDRVTKARLATMGPMSRQLKYAVGLLKEQVPVAEHRIVMRVGVPEALTSNVSTSMVQKMRYFEGDGRRGG